MEGRWRVVVPDLLREMLQTWWGVILPIGVTAVVTLVSALAWFRAMRRRVAYLDPFAIENVLARDQDEAGEAEPLLYRIMRTQLPAWSDWGDGGPSSGVPGRIVDHSRSAELREAIFSPISEAHGNVVLLTGPSGCGKTTMALGMGRECASQGWRRWRVYHLSVPGTSDAAASLRQAFADACRLAAWEWPCAGVLLILEDAHEAWTDARGIVEALGRDRRTRGMRIVVTARPLTRDNPDSQLRAWVGATPKIEMGGEGEYVEMAIRIAQRLCAMSQTRDVGFALKWEDIEDKVGKWLQETRHDLLAWNVLLCTLMQVDGDYEFDPSVMHQHVLEALDGLRTADHRRLSRLYEQHGVHPGMPVLVVALVQASENLAMSRRFVIDGLGVPAPIVDALIEAGNLSELRRRATPFLKLPHAGTARLISQAAEAAPETAAAMGALPLPHAEGRGGGSTRCSTQTAWRGYLHWIGATKDVPAFSSLCERVRLLVERRGITYRAVPGRVLHVRGEVMLGADPQHVAPSQLPEDGSVQPLGEVRLPGVLYGRAGGAGVHQFLQSEVRGSDRSALCGGITNSDDEAAAAGAVLVGESCDVPWALSESRRLLRDGTDPDLRMACAYLLGYHAYSAGGSELRTALAGATSRSVRAVSAWALGRLHPTPANTDALLDALDDHDDWVVCEAIWAMGHLIPLRVVPRLLYVRATHDLDTDQGTATEIALQAILDGHGEHTCRPSLGSDDHQARFGAAWCLATRGDAVAQELLGAYATDERPCLRRGAMAALSLHEWDIDSRVVLRCLYDEDTGVRAVAASTARRTGARELVPTLNQLLDDPDVTVVFHVIRALLRLGDRSAVTRLEQLTGDERRATRRYTIGLAATEAIDALSIRTP